MRSLPDQSRLLELFKYSEGNLVWARNKGIAKAGMLAGAVHHSGYIQVKVDGIAYRAHRLIWKLVTGKDPGGLSVDHIDGNKLNNAWDNLRLANSFQQQMNKPSVKGVYKLNRVKKDRWVACFRHKQLGIFDTEKEARNAYLMAYQEVAGDFLHISR